MLKVCLTGGISSGKTLASDYFKSLGASVIDTDIISRELVLPGQPTLQELQQIFGNNIITTTGELDRKVLRDIVFSHDQKLTQLNNIMHPRIRAQMLKQVNKATGCYAICVVPLLVETQQQHLFDRILLIDATVEDQISRLCQRDSISKEQAQKILATQTSREKRQKIAHDIVLNDGNSTSLYKKLEKLHQNYLTLAN